MKKHYFTFFWLHFLLIADAHADADADMHYLPASATMT